MTMASGVGVESGRDVIMDRLNEQVDWYDRKSSSCRRGYVRLKLATLTSAALIPFISGLPNVYPWIAGALGVCVVIFEGIQQVNQFHENWVTYRATCEALRHEKYLFLALAGPYATADRPKAMLAERVEALISTEQTKWVSQQEKDGVSGPRSTPDRPASQGRP